MKVETAPVSLPTPSSSSNSSPSPQTADIVLPASPNMLAFDLPHADAMSFLGDPSQPGTKESMDWTASWTDALTNPDGWKWGSGHIEIDPALMSISASQPPAYIDPAALQYPQHYPTATPQELLGLAPLLDAFPFSFQAPINPALDFPPSPESAPSDSASAVSEDELTRIARDAMGMVRGVVAAAPPAAPQPSGAKLPIPRLPRGSNAKSARPAPRQQASPESSASGSPPPTTPVDAPLAKPARPKTSHTTIERRYRTNLNARILALRAAVPATAILDANTEVRADARGLVDGVKAARKGSKATILGKAVEYITVLKRRETRLRRDVAGLRALVNSISNGPALLNAWEGQWTARFGTESDDDDPGADGGAESDDDDESGEDERPRKKAKTAPAGAKAKKDAASEEPRRKRGRPKKVVTPPVEADMTMPMLEQQPQQQQPATYLFAVFALVSLFNGASQSTAPAHAHTHEGAVLGSDVPKPQNTMQWGNALQIAASLAVLATVLLPIALRRARMWTAKVQSSVVRVEVETKEEELAVPGTPTSSSGEDEDLLAQSTVLSEASSESDGSSTEIGSTEIEPEATEASKPAAPAGFGASAVLRQTARFALARVGFGRSRAPEEVAAWLAKAEALILQGDAPLAPRLTAHLALSRLLAAGGTARELMALALLTGDNAAWSRAKRAPTRTACETAALTLTVDDACNLLLQPADEDDETSGVAERIARRCVHARARAVAERRFIAAARGEADPGADVLLALGGALGGRAARLARAVAELREEDVEDEDTQALIHAQNLLAEGGMKLRRALGAEVFESAPPGGALEDAWGRVVDRVRARA